MQRMRILTLALVLLDFFLDQKVNKELAKRILNKVEIFLKT